MILTKIVPFTPKQLLNKVAHLPWCQYLQSGDPNHENAHFDILVAEPVATLQTWGHQTKCQHLGVETISDADPFELCQQWRQRLFSKETTEHNESKDLPFTGGALGLWGYDLCRRVESISERPKPNLNTADMSIGFYDWALTFDHQAQLSHLLVNHPDAHNYLEQRCNWLMAQTQPQSPPFKLLEEWHAGQSKTDYQHRFDAIQEYLRSGDCYQINLTQQFAAKYQGCELDAYLRLTHANQAPFSAFIRLPEGCVLSVSPERFISLKGQTIETKPIKGTRPRSLDPELDESTALELKSAEKDRAENLMIVDLLRNDIGRVSVPGTVRVPSLFEVESFPGVHHLVSTVTGELDSTLSAEQLLRACFPGGSITGAPKVRAMQIIEQLEPHRRNAYCGAIGYISSQGNMDTNITIRTLVCEAGQIYAWAGGGIVADSNVNAEYQECFDKLNRILPTLSR